jgi:hypothetical protein
MVFILVVLHVVEVFILVYRAEIMALKSGCSFPALSPALDERIGLISTAAFGR